VPASDLRRAIPLSQKQVGSSKEKKRNFEDERKRVRRLKDSPAETGTLRKEGRTLLSVLLEKGEKGYRRRRRFRESFSNLSLQKAGKFLFIGGRVEHY